jgi:2-polyprenyl-3-methyl-5-hydroxy-6-metoxy-1,4-benzoquinol methylase
MFKKTVIPHLCRLCHHEFSSVCFIKDSFTLVRCLSCGLVSVSNPPSKAEIERLYSFASGYHVGFCDDNSPEVRYYVNQARYYYSRLQKYKTEGRILDIGCSAGLFLEVTREHGWDSYGIEISKDTAELARKRGGIKIVMGSLDQTRFRPKFFDVITMWDVVEHVEDPTHMMTIVHSILKDDGIIALSTPNIDGLFPKISYIISKFTKDWPHPEPPYHLFQFSKKTLQKLLHLARFEVLEVIDERSPIAYTFGSWNVMIRSPKRLLYSAMFLPTLLLGPSIHAGDSMLVFARKAHVRNTNHQNFCTPSN